MLVSFVSSLVSLCLIAPVNGAIIGPFVAPACPYCVGNRAIDFATNHGEEVRAPVSGVVHFAGSVGGRRYVTIRSGGELVTVGGLGDLDERVARGRVVRQGQRLGRATGRGDGSLDPVSLSVRHPEGLHLDPTPWLGRLVSAGPQSRLVPRDGTMRRPAPRAVCRPGG